MRVTLLQVCKDTDQGSSYAVLGPSAVSLPFADVEVMAEFRVADATRDKTIS